MFDDFNSLAETAADYAHRRDLVDRCKTLFIPLANVRLGRDLESAANEALVSFDTSATPAPFDLPADFGKIRSIVYGSKHALVARDEQTFYTLPQQGSNPLIYNIQDGKLRVRPTVAGTYNLDYFQVPTLDEANPVNDVLLRHPQLYLYAVLIELNVWVQDPEQRANALEFYNSEVKITNRAESRARMNAPQAIGL